MQSLLLAVLAAAPATSIGGDPPWDELPITILMIDDVGWNLLNGAHTPHLDQLMQEGVVFENAWSYPSCSPTRAALLSGRHAHRTGVGEVLKWQSAATNRGLHVNEVTLAEALGEPMDVLGKWHVGFRKGDPNTQGVRHYAGARFWQRPSFYSFKKTINGVVYDWTKYGTTDTTDDALASDAGVRLVSYHAVHTPLENPPGGTATSDHGKAYEMISYMDREIGRLLENYDGYLIFLSDNGSEWFLGGRKGTLYEGGIHVPFFVHGPGIEPRSVPDLVHAVDVFATVLEMRGLPSNAEDSISFLPVLRGGEGDRWWNLSEKFEPGFVEREQAVRTLDYKLFIDAAGTRLYAMPGEVLLPEPWNQDQQRAVDLLMALLP